MILQASANMVDLTELMSMICQNQVRAVLQLEKDDRRGEIYFNAGRIVHASFGELTGESALFELLAWGDESDVQVSPSPEPPTPTIARNHEYLLFEGARLRDERQRDLTTP